MNKPAGIIASAIVAVALIATGPAAAESGVDKLVWSDDLQPAPDVPFRNGEDQAMSLADFRGKVVVVNMWATWCAPCLREMPTLDTLQAELGGDDLQVIALSQDAEGISVAAPFMAENDWPNLALYVEPSHDFARAAGVRGLPTTLIIDRDGRMVARLQGTAEWDSEDIRSILRELMTGKK